MLFPAQRGLLGPQVIDPLCWPSVRPVGLLQVVMAQQLSQGDHSKLSRMDSSGTNADEQNAPLRACLPLAASRPHPLALTDTTSSAVLRRLHPGHSAVAPAWPRLAQNATGPSAERPLCPASVSLSVAWAHTTRLLNVHLRIEWGLCRQRQLSWQRHFQDFPRDAWLALCLVPPPSLCPGNSRWQGERICSWPERSRGKCC